MSAVLRLLKPERDDESFIASFILGRPATTQRVYRNQVREFLAFANKAIDRIEASDLRAFFEACRRHELRPGTIRHKIAVIKSFFGFLAQEGDLVEDPMSRVPTPPHAPPDGSRCLSSDQVAAFFGQIPSHRIVGLRDRAVFLLAANCGLRLSELSRLSIADVSEGPEKGWRTLRIHGKGDKVREVQVRPEVWAYVLASPRPDGRSGTVIYFRPQGAQHPAPGGGSPHPSGDDLQALQAAGQKSWSACVGVAALSQAFFRIGSS